MIFLQAFLYLLVTRVSCSDWISEWMNPVQDQFQQESRNVQKTIKKLFDNEAEDRLKNGSTEDSELLNHLNDHKKELSPESLKLRLEDTLQSAKLLSESLKFQIYELTSRESLLKEAIVNGRFGVSTLTVSSLNQVPRAYIIRDGLWTHCNGMIQFPVVTENLATQGNLFSELFKEPKCIGMEVSTIPDPCVFNSVIKYEVVPTRRALEYTEEDYLCLKPAFNKTFERYMSVPKRLINDTCKEGTIRTLDQNILECGIRMLYEYNYYPSKTAETASLPLEYCTEKDGSCKFIMAWHISNVTIENFEFLKNEHKFKKYFIQSKPHIEYLI